MSDTRTTIEGAYAITRIDRNDPLGPGDGSGDVFISVEMTEGGAGAGRVYTVIPADALRAAIDRAVGPLSDWERELLAGHVSEGERACLDRQRDRHLRHISDLEGTLARRNERHEKDQEMIREKDGQIEALGKRVVELEGSITALERLAAFVAAHGGTPQPEVEKAAILDYLGAANGTHRYVLSVPAATDSLEHTGPYTMTPEER